MKLSGKHLFWSCLILAAVAAGVLLLRPAVLPVETGQVTQGPLRVTVDEEGETRAHDRFVVAAPVAGRLARVDLHDGDPVIAGQVVATIHPLPLDPRERRQLIARVEAAAAGQREAEARFARARADAEQARRERERHEQLATGGIIDRQTLERVRTTEVTTARELEASRYAVRAAAARVAAERAGLVALEPAGPGRLVQLRSPVQGRVLRVLEKSERTAAAGTPLLEIGNPAGLEVVVDILSADAVKVRPGDAVILENWGGDRPLRARVRTVEPAGFTKVSALGVEEQRVNVVADFVDPPDGLGSGYRVEARIVVWEGANVLQVPTSALFRHGQGWALFTVAGGRARLRQVQVGQQGSAAAEILGGIIEGTTVILHPGNVLRDGDRVEVSARSRILP